MNVWRLQAGIFSVKVFSSGLRTIEFAILITLGALTVTHTSVFSELPLVYGHTKTNIFWRILQFVVFYLVQTDFPLTARDWQLGCVSWLSKRLMTLISSCCS